MTDEELGAELWPDGSPEDQLKLGASMKDEKRAVYERLITVGHELTLWEAGIGPKPAGIIVCGPKQVRRAGITPVPPPPKDHAHD